MSDFLIHLAALSLGGGVVALILMLTARFTHARYAARWRCWVWLVLCLRLAVPLPLLPDRPAQQAPIQLPVVEDRVVLRPAPGPAASTSEPSPAPSGSNRPAQPAASSSAPAEPEAGAAPGLSLSLSQLIFGLWLLGAAAVLIWNLLSHLRFCRYLNRWAAPVRDADILALYNALGDQLGLDRRPRLLSCPGLAVPMLAGLFRPALLLPENPPAGDALRFSLLHELTHFRRRDIFRKTLALWVRALHWFNPLVWLTARAMDRDIELSCDESALKHLPPAEHAAYGRTILSAVSALTGAGRPQSGSISDSEF